MSVFERILIGIAGALMPILANIYFFDFTSAAFNPISYGVKIGVLIMAGAVIGYLNNTETNKIKLFQLGLAIPSLLSAIYADKQQTSTIENIKKENELSLHTPAAPRFFIPFVSTAYAQYNTRYDKLKTYHAPEQNVWESVVQGLTGSQPENIWYVIAASETDLNKALAIADSINAKQLGFTAEVFNRYQSNRYYAVIIGANLTVEEAKALRTKAILKGLPKDTYLWSLK